MVIPAKTYKGQDKDVKTVTVQSVLAVSSELDDKLVYDLTKAIWDNQKELSGMLSALSDLNIKKALTGITTPYHPGAIKYYKEHGMMK